MCASKLSVFLWCRHICVGMFFRASTCFVSVHFLAVSNQGAKRGGHLCFPGRYSRGWDTSNGLSVVRDKVLLKSQAGNETRQDIRGDRAMLRKTLDFNLFHVCPKAHTHTHGLTQIHSVRFVKPAPDLELSNQTQLWCLETLQGIWPGGSEVSVNKLGIYFFFTFQKSGVLGWVMQWLIGWRNYCVAGRS